MWAIISDIHGNLAALEFVLRDIRTRGIPEERILCLGDIVGYGPDPIECVDHAMAWPVVLRGNHDDAVFNDPVAFNPPAKEAIHWTRDLLSPRFLSGPQVRRRWAWLRDLPTSHFLGRALLVHASPRDPISEYILPRMCGDGKSELSPDLKDIFSRFEWTCFVGHTHEPGVVPQTGGFLTPSDLEYRIRLAEDRKYIVNVGSVGQPRDRNPRSCYVTFDGQVVEYHRVEYPVELTQERIRREPRLHPIFADRLALGK